MHTRVLVVVAVYACKNPTGFDDDRPELIVFQRGDEHYLSVRWRRDDWLFVQQGHFTVYRHVAIGLTAALIPLLFTGAFMNHQELESQKAPSALPPTAPDTRDFAHQETLTTAAATKPYLAAALQRLKA